MSTIIPPPPDTDPTPILDVIESAVPARPEEVAGLLARMSREVDEGEVREVSFQWSSSTHQAKISIVRGTGHAAR